jgi:V/A-type H+-transporting ATPase subunit K
MEIQTMKALGQIGAFSALTITALGSSLGTGIAGCSAIGAWKKCFQQNKMAPFQLVIFGGAPLSQPIYAMILMVLLNAQAIANPIYWSLYLTLGITAGVAMGLSSWRMGVAGASACDSFGETGKGFVNNLMIIGIIETISIFILAFGIVLLTSVK